VKAGTKHKPESLAKIGDAQKGKVASAGTKAKLAAAHDRRRAALARAAELEEFIEQLAERLKAMGVS